MGELKAGDKIVQQMTRNGAVEINKATGGAENISAREPTVSPDSAIIGGVVDRVQTERRAARKKAVRKANRKIFESVQRKPETTRLTFTDAERADPALTKSIQKSDRAADRYETARARIPKEKVLSIERVPKKPDNKANIPKNKSLPTQRVLEKPTGETKTRLVFRERDKSPNGKLTHALDRPKRETASAVHGEIEKSGGDNTGVQAAHSTEKAAEKTARTVRDVHSRLKFEPQRQLLKAEEKAVKANVNALYKRDLQIKPEFENANPTKKALHKRKIKRDYAKSFRQGNFDRVKQTAATAKKTAQKAKETTEKTVKFAVKNWKLLAVAGGLLFFVILLAAGISSCMAMFGGGFTGVVGTSYTAEDADIIGANDDYTALESSLQQRINNIPSDYPGYDEYNYSLDAIGHDPFGLASYLTSKYNAYTQAAVQGDLAGILAQQYRLTVTPVTEIRYRTETRIGYYTDADGVLQSYTYDVEVPYYYYILNVSLVNNGLDSVALSSLTPEQYEMYLVYMETKGNKPELFP